MVHRQACSSSVTWVSEARRLWLAVVCQCSCAALRAPSLPRVPVPYFDVLSLSCGPCTPGKRLLTRLTNRGQSASLPPLVGHTLHSTPPALRSPAAAPPFTCPDGVCPVPLCTFLVKAAPLGPHTCNPVLPSPPQPSRCSRGSSPRRAASWATTSSGTSGERRELCVAACWCVGERF